MRRSQCSSNTAASEISYVPSARNSARNGFGVRSRARTRVINLPCFLAQTPHSKPRTNTCSPTCSCFLAPLRTLAKCGRSCRRLSSRPRRWLAASTWRRVSRSRRPRSLPSTCSLPARLPTRWYALRFGCIGDDWRLVWPHVVVARDLFTTGTHSYSPSSCSTHPLQYGMPPPPFPPPPGPPPPWMAPHGHEGMPPPPPGAPFGCVALALYTLRVCSSRTLPRVRSS